ncbi:MAG: D-alanyl-D-alanine carboxypeptidase [Oscillospiraceae bacterium]|nr:D-alanyl-D-alanine carboxypeptidase [Oscillospiraceae bacterium]
MKKKFFSVIFAFLFAFLFVFQSFAVFYEPETDDADIVYMISLDNGTVICDVNSEKRASPASMTKIVTAILTIENCTDLEQVVTVPAYCIRLLDGTNSSTAGILVGEELTVRELLYCLLVYSANDAANILADFIGGGDIETFVEKMNAFVKLLGCENTHFDNAHGLDSETHYTTARDLAKIYSYCLQNSLFCEIAGTFTTEIPATNKYHQTRYLRNTNSLLNPGIPDYYSEYVKNGKTGTTDSAGRCVISSASYDGYNYLLVVMNAKFYDYDNDGVNENMAFVLSKEIYEWAYKNLRIREVANPSVYVGEAEVRLSKEYDYVSLVPETSVSALVPSGVGADNVLIEIYDGETLSTVDAPVKKGDVLGKAAIKYAGQTVAEVNLVAAFDVERSPLKYVGDIILKTVNTLAFKIIAVLVFVVILPIFLVMFTVIPAKRRKKKNAVRMVNVKDIDNRKKR